MNLIYLLVGYNNYYNRQLKKLATVQQYLQASQQYYEFNDVINFNPNDGISTTHIFNFQLYDLNGPEPDYMIVVNDNVIEQRWFVLDGERTRAGQYHVHLYRDTVAEQWQNIGNLPMFVEKAIVSQTDPAIFNSENMTFNQIKQEETLLKDSTGCAWVVGYMTNDAIKDNTNYILPGQRIDYSVDNITEYPYYQYTTGGNDSMPVSINTAKTYYVNITALGEPATDRRLQISFNENFSQITTDLAYNGSKLILNDDSQAYAFRDTLRAHANDITNGLAQYFNIQPDILSNEVDKIIEVKGITPKFYRVQQVNEITKYYTREKVKVGDDAFKAFDSTVSYVRSLEASSDYLIYDSHANDDSYEYTVSVKCKQLVLQQFTPSNSTVYNISNSRNRLSDQPYSMFCMPYGTTTVVGFGGATVTRNFKDITLEASRAISQKFGGASPVLYDIQLLPYFPIQNIISGGGVNISNLTEGEDFDYIKTNNTLQGIMFWATKSTGSLNIIHTIAVQDYKIENETKMYRLVSPNYNGVFEFSAAKNGGVGSFNVDFTYKPFQPYIHVNPNFGLLYGQDFDDARGLICGGKFDLPQTSDAWATYERQNTNYNAIFDRQIDNLELQNKIGKAADIVSAVAGSVQGASAGASMGAAAGPYGAAIGAAVGGTVSLAAGIADVSINEKLRNEVIDYKKDLYGFSLQNIQAQPNSLVSVGALNANNKLFPFLEEYDCTTQERDALINKIRYNGMTVGRIGTINQFKSNTWSYSNGWNYIKGQLIRVPIWGDTHYIATLASEMEKGIFVEV